MESSPSPPSQTEAAISILSSFACRCFSRSSCWVAWARRTSLACFMAIMYPRHHWCWWCASTWRRKTAVGRRRCSSRSPAGQRPLPHIRKAHRFWLAADLLGWCGWRSSCRKRPSWASQIFSRSWKRCAHLRSNLTFFRAILRWWPWQSEQWPSIAATPHCRSYLPRIISCNQKLNSP